MKLSIIVPSFNEEETLNELYNELIKTFKEINFEIIFVNDGSFDNTFKILKDLYSQDKERVRVINFSRNFGKEASIYAV